MRPHRFLLLLAASCVLTSSILAKGDREKVESPARVILFSGTHFTGERIELKVGEKIDDFRYQRFPSGRNANNRISSVRIDGKVEVSFYEYRAFDGDSITVEDVPEAAGALTSAFRSPEDRARAATLDAAHDAQQATLARAVKTEYADLGTVEVR